MYKHVTLPVRRAGMSHDEFVAYWQDDHTPIARDTEGVVRYQTILSVGAEASELDGLVEFCFDDLDAFHDALGGEGSRDYDPTKGTVRKARADVDNFLDAERHPRIIDEEVVEKDETGGDTTGLYKHPTFPVHKGGMSRGELLDYWANARVLLAREVPGVIRHARVISTDLERAEFDDVAEPYLENLDTLRAGLGHESSHDYDPDRPRTNTPRGDVSNFLSIDDCLRFISRGTVQKDASGG